MNTVVLWVSHILIRHERSDSEVPFVFGGAPSSPPPKRTREEALALALSVRERAAAAPETFARLAKEYSEDAFTGPEGGSLGGIAASQLLTDSPVLDALAAIGPGEVSRVVETRHGFHVLLRRAPPPLATIAARRIVVPYVGVRRVGTVPVAPTRSRSDALAVAQSVAATLRNDPARFDELLARYSPPEQIAEGGDFGVWTNQEQGVYPRERERLAQLKVGEITDPIEGTDGFQVFVRTAIPVEWAEYAVRVNEVWYRADAPPQDAQSHDNVLRKAQETARVLVGAPDRWEALRGENCCAEAQFWSRGRTARSWVEMVASLPIGGVSPVPLDRRPYFRIVQRLDPSHAEPAPVRFDLPAPDGIDLRRIAASSRGTAVQKFVRALGDQTSKALGLDPDAARRLTSLHDQLAVAFGDRESRQTREQALDTFDTQLRSVLNADQYTQYRKLAENIVGAKVMQ
jgi:hypothetical protein